MAAIELELTDAGRQSEPGEGRRRDFDTHPVPGQDADAEPPHLACHVAQDLVSVVELHPEHRVRERLDDLAFELDLLLFRQELYDPDVRRLGPLGSFAELVFDLGAFGQGAEPVTRDGREVDERVLPPSSGVMKPKPFSSLNHFTTPVAI